MIAALDRLAIALWRAHAKTLHSAMHGKTSAEALTLTDAQFDKQYAPMKAAWIEATRALLVELKDLDLPTPAPGVQMSRRIAVTTFIDSVLNDPVPIPVSVMPMPAVHAEDLMHVTVQKAVVDSVPNPTGIPGGAHIA